MLPTRALGPFQVSAISLGCMNLSHAYGEPASFETSQNILHRALDLGVTMFDTAALYGFGANEILVGKVLSPHRHKFTLASKCGMTGIDGKRVIDGRPATIKRTCEEALKRLQTDVIDLYYLHRLDKGVPIEESLGAMADLVREGKIRAIGLSEMSAATLRRAHAVHPIAAMQTEYSLWTRNPEIAVLDACKMLGVAFVAFSPLARAFLTGTLRDVSNLNAKDLRVTMPRFQPAAYAVNLKLLDGYKTIADEVGCTMGQLALAWLLAKGEHIIPIPGTTRLAHLEENVAACHVMLSADVMTRLDRLINQHTVVGARYTPAAQADAETEEFEKA